MSLPRTVRKVILVGWSTALDIHTVLLCSVHTAQTLAWGVPALWSPSRSHWHIQGPSLIQGGEKYVESTTPAGRPGDGLGLFLNIVFQWQAAGRRQPAAEYTGSSPVEALIGTELLRSMEAKDFSGPVFIPTGAITFTPCECVQGRTFLPCKPTSAY